MRRAAVLLAVALLAACQQEAPAPAPAPVVAAPAPAPVAPRAVSPAVPPLALVNAPVLVGVQRQIWPAAPEPWFLAGQVEQESCVSLKNPKCWNPTVELKTNREYGFGLGQTTIAYKVDGSERFNKWAELRTQYPSLRAWTWENRFDPALQLTAMVEMMKALFKPWTDAATVFDRIAFALSAYNGGQGAVMQDRLLCRNTEGCDATRWFKNVELHSLKAKVPYKGYAKSPFEINREYPRAVLLVRRMKYEPFFLGA